MPPPWASASAKTVLPEIVLSWMVSAPPLAAMPPPTLFSPWALRAVLLEIVLFWIVMSANSKYKPPPRLPLPLTVLQVIVLSWVGFVHLAMTMLATVVVLML